MSVHRYVDSKWDRHFRDDQRCTRGRWDWILSTSDRTSTASFVTFYLIFNFFRWDWPKSAVALLQVFLHVRLILLRILLRIIHLRILLFYMDSFLEFSNLRGSHGLRQVIIHPILSLLSLWKFVKVSGICSKILLLCIIFTKKTIIIFPFGQKVLCVHTCDQTFISYQKKHCGPSLGYFYPQLMLA